MVAGRLGWPWRRAACTQQNHRSWSTRTNCGRKRAIRYSNRSRPCTSRGSGIPYTGQAPGTRSVRWLVARWWKSYPPARFSISAWMTREKPVAAAPCPTTSTRGRDGLTAALRRGNPRGDGAAGRSARTAEVDDELGVDHELVQVHHQAGHWG